jgi:hypothetical protein
VLSVGALKLACAFIDGSKWRVSDSECRMLENIRNVVSDYEKHLHGMPFVPTFSYGRRMLLDYGAPNLFSDLKERRGHSHLKEEALDRTV